MLSFVIPGDYLVFDLICVDLSVDCGFVACFISPLRFDFVGLELTFFVLMVFWFI